MCVKAGPMDAFWRLLMARLGEYESIVDQLTKIQLVGLHALQGKRVFLLRCVVYLAPVAPTPLTGLVVEVYVCLEE